jgi:hypothetical protein
MSEDWTPTKGDVLEAWVAHQAHDQPTALDLVDAYDSFNRWLATEKAKWQADERERIAQALARELGDGRAADIAREKGSDDE